MLYRCISISKCLKYGFSFSSSFLLSLSSFLPLFPGASENSPALDNSLGYSLEMEQSFSVSNSAYQEKITQRGSKQENNQEPILKLFIEKQAYLPPPPYKENSLKHIFCLPQSQPFPTACLDALKGLFNIFSPKHNFFLLTTPAPSYKMTTEHGACRATWKL